MPDHTAGLGSSMGHEAYLPIGPAEGGRPGAEAQILSVGMTIRQLLSAMTKAVRVGCHA
jgi:hypothetical protein